jgi:hypothetical protein
VNCRSLYLLEQIELIWSALSQLATNKFGRSIALTYIDGAVPQYPLAADRFGRIGRVVRQLDAPQAPDANQAAAGVDRAHLCTRVSLLRRVA